MTFGQRIAGLLAWAFGLASAATLGLQAYLWLKGGQWISIPVGFLLIAAGNYDLPQTDWEGIQKLMWWFVMTPLWIDAAVAAFIAGCMARES